MALNSYITQVQRLLHDPNATYYSVSDLTAYINTARGQIAAEGQCVRVLLPSTGPILSISIVNGGTGYLTPPAVTITGTGSGATAHTTIFSGSVNTITVDTQGKGYDTSTVITIAAPASGTRATATANLNVWNAVLAQEVYNFSAANVVAQSVPGVSGILGLISVSVSWGSQKPTLQKWVWSDFQSYLRSNNTGLQSWPAMWSQYGQGANGSIYVYPLPSQNMQWDWDCYCIVIPLVNDADPEAIPYPWSDAVQYYAAYLAYYNSQRRSDGDAMFAVYEQFMKRARANSEPDFTPDPYEGFL